MLQLRAGCLFSLWLTALIWMLQCINKQINSLCHKVGHVICLFDKKLSASAVHSLLSPLVNSCKVWTKEKKDKYEDEKKNSYPKWDNRSKFRYICPQWDNSIWNQIVSKIQTHVGSILNILHDKIQCQVLFSLYALYRLRFHSELIVMMQLFGKTVPWIELHRILEGHREQNEGEQPKKKTTKNKCNVNSIILRCISEVICSPSKTNHPKPISSLYMTRKVRSKQM